MAEQVEYLTKQVETDVKRVPVSEYIGDLTHNLTDEGQIQVIREVVAKSLEGAPEGTDFCLLSNGIGHSLTERRLYLAAAEAYEFAFAEEDPYHANRPVYALNYVTAINNHLQSVEPARAQEATEVMRKKRQLIREARNCIVLFKNQAVYKVGHDQVIKENGAVSWTTDEQKSQAASLQQAEVVADNLLRTANMLS